MEPQHLRRQGRHILYDAERLPEPDDELFDPAALARAGRLTGRPDGGRGSACFLEVAGIPAVLRPYRRGGLLGPLLKDRYLRGQLQVTRPWQEWWLLARLHEEGLPVPAPLAARVRPTGLCYRGEILIERLAAVSLPEALLRAPLPTTRWLAIGAAIGQLHRRGVDHADLNAHNILLTGDGGVYLIDLDRARLRTKPAAWCERNLARLRRSLRKLATANPALAVPQTEALTALQQGWQQAIHNAPRRSTESNAP
ncbi:MAG: 3-deoxy-D-manno-octulosonic acid kinase [Halorhodospira sp.]